MNGLEEDELLFDMLQRLEKLEDDDDVTFVREFQITDDILSDFEDQVSALGLAAQFTVVVEGLRRTVSALEVKTVVDQAVAVGERVASGGGTQRRFERGKPHCNIGTIGHVDHGKTTLTAA
ncbi:GTP-binding protein, partial [Mameliella alba]